MPPLGAQWMVVVLVRALSSMSSFARDCMEVMGHVTPPYICSFKEGSHSPCLSSVPLAGYISSNGELGTI